VGYGIIPLTNVSTQSSKEIIPILIYNGSDTLEELHNLGKSFKTFFSGSSTGPIQISDEIHAIFIYNADMANIRHTCYVSAREPIEGNLKRKGNKKKEEKNNVDEMISRMGGELVEKTKEEIIEGDLLSCNCIRCGLNLNKIRSGENPKERISLVHCWGIPVLGFCILHAISRLVETILLLSCRGNMKKMEHMASNLVEKRFVREHWKFLKIHGTFRPEQIFGDEAQKILSHVNDVFPDDDSLANLMKTLKELKDDKLLVMNFGNRGRTFYSHLIVLHLGDNERMLRFRTFTSNAFPTGF